MEKKLSEWACPPTKNPGYITAKKEESRVGRWNEVNGVKEEDGETGCTNNCLLSAS